MVFGRYKESELTQGKILPEEWTESFVQILTQTYAEQSDKDNRFFDVYGRIFDQEFVAAISYIHHGDQVAAPTTLFISHDIIDDNKKMAKAMDAIVTLASIIFDDIFADDKWSDFNPTWTQNNYEGHDFFYKITRENVSLTIQADEILKKGGLV